VDRAVTLGRLATVRRNSASLRPSDRAISNLGLAFERALNGLYLLYHPIVASRQPRVVGYEALARTREQSLANPVELFSAAEELDRVHEISRLIRERAIEPFAQAEDDVLLFVNLHPIDLLDEDLYDPKSPFAQQAKRIVLEITERAQFDATKDLFARIARLRNLGFQLAVDDIGAGYSELASFAHIEPQVVKIDISLVRRIEESPTKQRIVRSLVELCDDLSANTVAEGVETAAEQACCTELGCTWQQGYRFARPGAAFPTVDWAAPESGG
jgi:EAL domain-containing protein (putative c-di-GMP-specific phosphodiesterase class I)